MSKVKNVPDDTSTHGRCKLKKSLRRSEAEKIANKRRVLIGKMPYGYTYYTGRNKNTGKTYIKRCSEACKKRYQRLARTKLKRSETGSERGLFKKVYNIWNELW